MGAAGELAGSGNDKRVPGGIDIDLAEMSTRQRLRSPRYPSEDVRRSASRIAHWLAHGSLEGVHAEEAARRLGFAGSTGPAKMALAAARQYGFIEVSGDLVRVSEGGLAVAGRRGPEARQEALWAALERATPFMFLLPEFKNGADQERLRSLLISRHFTPRAAQSALDTFLDSVRFAESPTDHLTADPLEVGSPSLAGRRAQPSALVLVSATNTVARLERGLAVSAVIATAEDLDALVAALQEIRPSLAARE